MRIVDAESQNTLKKVNDVCNQPPMLKPKDTVQIECKGYIEWWTFNSNTGECEMYVYGGCGGSANLFNTYMACQAACGEFSKSKFKLKMISFCHIMFAMQVGERT